MTKKFHRQFVNAAVFCVRMVTLISLIASQFFGVVTPVLAADDLSITSIVSDTPDPSEIGGNVAISVTVTGDSGTATGTVDITGADTNCTITLTDGAGSCDVAFSSSGEKTLTADYSGDSAYAVSSDTETHTVSDPPANTPPVITEGDSTSVIMNVNGTPTAFDLTLHATDADTLTWSITSLASHGTASASGTGESKIIGYTPVTDYVGSDSFTVQVSDGNAGTDTITVTVNVVIDTHAPGIRYAMPNGTSDCSSWTNACTLQTALTTAISGDEIWAAAGTYKPAETTDRTISFVLKNGVEIYGGFNGTETLRAQRDPAANISILSGDIGTVDEVTDNSYHVVIGSGVDGTAILDGFTVTGGNASDNSASNGYGGGIYNDNSSPTVTNVTFSGNSAKYGGGGMYNYINSSPTITNVTFSGNSVSNGQGGGILNDTNSNPTVTDTTFSGNSSNNGGGMYNTSSSPILMNVIFNGNSASMGGGMSSLYNSSPTVTNVTFSNNSADGGGGMANYFNSSPTVTNVTFSNNSAANSGGGMLNDTNSNSIVTNVTFNGNSARYGGGMANVVNSSPAITNATFYANSADDSGGGMYNANSSPTLTNVTFTANIASYNGGGLSNTNSSNPNINDGIFWGNSEEIYNNSSAPVIKDSIVGGGCPSGSVCTNIIDADPLFGTLANYGGYTQTIPITVGSPAINAGGVNSTCETTDQRGESRMDACDIGAYEYNNVAPVITEGTSVSVAMSKDGSPNAFDVTLHATDENSIDTLTWSVSTPAAHGVATASGTGSSKSIGYTPTTNYLGTDSFVVRVSDGELLDTITVNIMINGIRYATPGGLSSGSCNTWETACELRYALSSAFSGDEIWVVAGTYTPTATINRTISFELKNGVALYGGFSGTETLRTQRDPAVNISILSGNIGTADTSDNSYHVVVGSGTDSTAVLDGFTITGGKATSNIEPNDRGAGTYNSSGSPTITNVIYNANAAYYGGGMYNSNSSPTLANVAFNANTANSGGGVFNSSGSNPVLTSVTFNNNIASGGDGGGMLNLRGGNGGVFWGSSISDPTLTNVTFTENTAANSGGGMYTQDCNPTLINVSFNNNTAFNGNGGGMYGRMIYFTNNSGPIMTNVSFSGNSSIGSGGGLYNYNYSPILTNATFSENTASDFGGGMANVNTANPSLTDVTFNKNTAGNGGGIYNYNVSNPTLTNVTLSGNSVTGSGGGIYNTNYSAPVLTNVTFSGNKATVNGGGLANYYTNNNPYLINTTFNDNSVTNGNGGGIYSFYGVVTVQDSILWGNGTEVFNEYSSPTIIIDSVVENGCTDPDNASCVNVTYDDPKLGVLANYGGFTQTIPLMVSSSAIDTGGVNSTCAQTDQRGVARVGQCDIGAYEYNNLDPVINEGASISVTMSENNSPTSFDLTLHATDADADTLTWSITSQASHGTASVSGTGASKAIAYTPEADFVGTDSFVVQAADDSLATDTITVNVTVNGVRYAAPGGLTSGWCGAWATACELRYALSSSLSGDEIWAAAGTYKPTDTTTRTVSFALKNGVAIYGGFAGTETLLSQRDPSTNITILSGDIGTAGVITDNSYHVVSGSSTNNTAILDGLTISDGNANGSFPNNSGGGMYTASGSPALNQLIFTNNKAGFAGGGMYNNTASAPTLGNITFSANTAPNGGGIYNNSGSAPTLNTVTFNNNSTTSGGAGMFNNSSSPALTNVTFYGNAATGNGGGMLNNLSSPALTNVTFSANTAASGGGIYNSNTSNPTINDTIIWGNGAAVFNSSSVPVIKDSVVQGDCPAGSTCTNVINADPKIGNLGNYGGYTQTVAITAGSSAINSGGVNSTCALTDQRGVARTGACDIGAYEYANISPVITEGDPASVTMSMNSAPTAFDLTLHAADGDADTLTWSVSSPASHGTASASGTGESKAIGYTPDTDYTGSDSFVVQVDDGSGGTDSITVNVNVQLAVFDVRPNEELVEGYNWPEGTTISIEIDDPHTPGSINNSGAALVGPEKWFDYYPDDGYDIQAGDVVTITGAGITKTITVTSLAITGVDLNTSIVTGAAGAGTNVDIQVCSDTDCYTRYVTAADGSWTAYFSQVGTQPDEQTIIDLRSMPGKWLDSWQLDEDGNGTYYEIQLPKPRIITRTDDDWLRARDWPVGTSLTLTIDDPDDGTGDVDFEAYKTAALGDPNFGWGPLGTYADFNLNGFDVKANQIITVSGGGIIRTLTPTDLAITAVNEEANTVSGTSTSSLKVYLSACDYSGNDCYYNRNVTPAANTWMVDFSEDIDLTAGSNGTAEQRDAVGNITRANWRIPNPNVQISAKNNWVQGQDWTLGDTVTIEIDNNDNGLPEISRQAVVETADWDASQTNFNYNFANEDDFDIQVGDVVTVTDGAVSQSATVTALSITDVNVETDVVSGIASPGAEVEVWACLDLDCSGSQYATADVLTGVWQLDFSDSYDIVPGSWIDSREYDADYLNSTVYGVTVPNPRIQANPADNWVQAFDWPDGSTLTLTISGNPETYQATASWNENGNQTQANFNLNGFDIQANQILTVTDNGSPAIERTYTVTSLAVTELNADLDTISGVGEPGVEIQVCANISNGCTSRYVTPAPITGAWTVSYSGSLDLIPGSNGWASQPGSNNVSQTWVNWRIPNPWLQADPDDDWVQAYDWPLGSNLTLTIDQYPSTYEATVTQMGNQTFAQFNLNEFDLQANQVITVTDNEDPAIERTYTITSLEITDINTALDTISGFGVPGTKLQVCVNTPSGCSIREVTPAAVSGEWTVDYSGLVDIVPGSNGWAVQPTQFENRTWINWTASAQNCHTLTLGHTGDGSDLTANPSNSTDCPIGTYLSGESISLSDAAPDANWQISDWTGTQDDSSMASTNAITMPAFNHSVSVNYSPIEYTLTVTSAHGTVTESPDHLTHHYGDIVTLTANANAGWVFDSWSGCTSTDNTCSVSMDGNKVVTAIFKVQAAPFNKNGPLNGTGGITTTQSLSWAASSGAALYEYCIDMTDNSTCDSGVWRSAGTGTSVTPSGILRGYTYYWQVRAVYAGGYTYADSGTWWSYSTLPGLFYKTGPANGATGVSFSPTLNWGASAGATDYEYCIDTNSGAACENTWTSTENVRSLALSGLTSNTTYYWHVRSVYMGAYTYSNSNTWWSFTTQTITCYNLTLDHTGDGSNAAASPSNSDGCAAGAYVEGENIILSSAAPDANWQISSWTGTEDDLSTSSTNSIIMPAADHTASVNYSQIEYTLTVTAEHGAVTEAPDHLTHRYGDVVTLTVNADTGWVFDGWSGCTSTDNTCLVTMDGNKVVTAIFKTQAVPFNKSAPANGSTGKATNTSLSWETSAGAVLYEYCIDTTDNSICDSGVWRSTGTSTSVTPGGILGGSSYYWQVRALYASGYTTADGGTWWSYSTLPGAFNKSSPANGVTGRATTTMISWGSSAGAVSYEYCLDTDSDSDCDNPTGWVNVGSNRSAALSALVGSTTYYWQVRAVNTGGGNTEANAGSWWNFRTTSCYTLTTNMSPSGSVSANVAPNCAGGKYSSGTVVQLTAAAGTGYAFGSWSGSATGAANPLSLTINGNKTVTANFTQNEYTLDVLSAHGSVTKSPQKDTYHYGEEITLSMAANDGWTFTDWTPALTDNKVTINSNTTVTANFAQLCYTLTTGVNPGGSGNVGASPASNCADGKYTYGTAVTLTATPGALYGFTGWSGAASGSVNPVSITMDGDKMVTGNFSLLPGALNKSTPANGVTGRATTTTITWGSSVGAVSYEYCLDMDNDTDCDNPTGWVNVGSNRSAALSALVGSTNYYWQVRAVNVGGNTEANAGSWWNFRTTSCYNLTTSVNPSGSGSVISNVAPNCAGGKYSSGTVVQLTAAAGAGYTFGSWSGSATGVANPLSLTINGNKTVTANFTQNEYTLDVVSAHGSVTKSPQKDTYHYGEEVTLSMTANDGWTFTDWTPTLTDNKVTVNGNTTVTATFTQNEYTLDVVSVHGSVTKSPQKDTYHYGEEVTLSMTANDGWTFTDWTPTLTDNKVTISGNTTVTANFTQNEYTLDVVSAHGSVTKSPQKDTYHYGEEVTLSMSANDGWIFTDWTPALTDNKVTINGNTTVTANFTQLCYTLTTGVNPGGSGSVGASPASNCAGGKYTYGTLVQLTAAAGTGYTFGNWSGSATGTANPISVTMDGDKAVTGNFSLSLPGAFNKSSPANGVTGRATTTTISWGGSVGAVSYEYCLDTDSDTDCDNPTGWVNVGSNRSAALSALVGSATYYWQVRAMNTGGGSTEANAGSWWNFRTTSCYSLTTSVSPSGSGSVSANVAPNCAGGKYSSGTVVQLTAAAGTGYTFGNWSGSATGTANPVSVTMNGNKTVTANFTPQ